MTIWPALILVVVLALTYVYSGIGVTIFCGFWSGWQMAKGNEFFYNNFEFYFGLMGGTFVMSLIAMGGDFQNSLLASMICAFFYILSYVFSYYIWLDFEKMWEKLLCKSAMENLDFDHGEEFD